MDPFYANLIMFFAGVIGCFVGYGLGKRRGASRENSLMGVPSGGLYRHPSPAASAARLGSDAPMPSGEIDEDIRQLALNGKKIEAIKLLRQRTGMSLKDSKDAVETVT